MSSVAGIINFKKNLFMYEAYNRLLVRDMACGALENNFPNSSEWVGEHSAFSVTTPNNTERLIKKTVEGYEFIIACYSDAANLTELKKDLIKFGYDFTTGSDAEILLYTYIHYGEECCKKVSYECSFCVWDSMRQQIFICRGNSDTPSFFYAEHKNAILFATDMKSLFHYPEFTPRLDKESLSELLTFYPFKTENSSVLKDVSELTPLSYLIINRCGIYKNKYSDYKNTSHHNFNINYFQSRISIFKPIIQETLNLQEYLNKQYSNLKIIPPVDIDASDNLFENNNAPINVFIDRKNVLKSPEHIWALTKINEFLTEFKPSII